MTDQLDFQSLTKYLNGWFDKAFNELPSGIQKRIKKDFFPMPWDDLSVEQRQDVANQWDCQNDPAMESERQYWWDFFIRRDELEKQIKQWSDIASTNATDLAIKEKRLTELNAELANISAIEANANLKKPNKLIPSINNQKDTNKPEYIAYPMAMKKLRDKWQATPEELAAWLWLHDEDLAAYTNANELDSPPRFNYGYYSDSGSFDYIKPLMACWFISEELASFKPDERYITGKQLIERWQKYPDIHPEEFIRAKIRESRLMDGHPICGLTRGTNPGVSSSPPLELALFGLSYVEAIEHSDFGEIERDSQQKKAAGHLNFDPDMQKRANEIAAEFFANRNRHPTKLEVVKVLAIEVGKSAETVTRRIRVNWKSSPKTRK